MTGYLAFHCGLPTRPTNAGGGSTTTNLSVPPSRCQVCGALIYAIGPPRATTNGERP